MKLALRGLLIVCTFLLSGCMMFTELDVKEARGGDQHIQIAKVLKGALPGPDGFHGRSYMDGCKIMLHGVKSTYTTGEFDVEDDKIKKGQKVDGKITIDRSKRKARVSITVDGEPYRFNGGYTYEFYGPNDW